MWVSEDPGCNGDSEEKKGWREGSRKGAMCAMDEVCSCGLILGEVHRGKGDAFLKNFLEGVIPGAGYALCEPRFLQLCHWGGSFLVFS